MKLLTHPAVTALGLATLYSLATLNGLASPRHDVVYHWSGSAAGLFLPGLLDFCAVWLLVAILVTLARNTARWGLAIWAALILPLPWVFLKNWQAISNRHVPLWISAVALTVAIVTFIAVVFRRSPTLTSSFQRVQRLTATVMGFVAIVALLVLGQILWLGWKARNIDAVSPLHQTQTLSSATGPRLVWILFDEISYRQVYERRFPGLRLPAFDALASQATLFTHVIPAGHMTENIIPSLFTGQPVDSITISADGSRFSMRSTHSGAWVSFNPHNTVFQDALNNGYSTAIAGWYNPYCRILPQVLDQCFWTYNMPGVGWTSPADSILENLAAPVRHNAGSFLSLIRRLRREPFYSAREAGLHQLDYERISSAADHLLEDRSASFIFLHLPVPHPGGIYNRRTQQFATRATYIDNLALADRYLAHVQAILEQNGTWDSSIIVVMGDHSWRTASIWSAMPSWSPEEQAASDGGQFDDRPAYIVKLSHQHQPTRIDSPYEAIHTRALLDRLIDGQVHSPDDLSAWAGSWHEDGPPTNAIAGQ